MTESILIDQQDKFDGKHDVKINLYDVFSNKSENHNVPKRQFELNGNLHVWYLVGTLKKEQLEKLPFLDLSICERWDMIPIENKEQIEQVKQLL